MPIIINCIQRTACSYAKTGLKSKGKFWIHFLWKVWLMYGLVSTERIGHNLRHIKVAIKKKKRSWYSKQILVYISICSHITKIFLLRGTVKKSLNFCLRTFLFRRALHSCSKIWNDLHFFFLFNPPIKRFLSCKKADLKCMKVSSVLCCVPWKSIYRLAEEQPTCNSFSQPMN